MAVSLLVLVCAEDKDAKPGGGQCKPTERQKQTRRKQEHGNEYG
jgi:hypothetical protein